MRKIDEWLNEYGESHRNHMNEIIHWICVPLIFFSVMGFLYCIKLPFQLFHIQFNSAFIASFAAVIYYLRLSQSLWVGLLLFSALCLFLCEFIERSGLTLWLICLIIFTGAWIGQFYGHNVEGKKPSFL